MIQYTVKRILLMESYLTNIGAASVYSLTDSDHPTIVTVNIFLTTGDSLVLYTLCADEEAEHCGDQCLCEGHIPADVYAPAP